MRGIGPSSKAWFDVFDRLLTPVRWQEVDSLQPATQQGGVDECVSVCA